MAETPWWQTVMSSLGIPGASTILTPLNFGTGVVQTPTTVTNPATASYGQMGTSGAMTPSVTPTLSGPTPPNTLQSANATVGRSFSPPQSPISSGYGLGQFGISAQQSTYSGMGPVPTSTASWSSPISGAFGGESSPTFGAAPQTTTASTRPLGGNIDERQSGVISADQTAPQMQVTSTPQGDRYTFIPASTAAQWLAEGTATAEQLQAAGYTQDQYGNWSYTGGSNRFYAGQSGGVRKGYTSLSFRSQQAYDRWNRAKKQQSKKDKKDPKEQVQQVVETFYGTG